MCLHAGQLRDESSYEDVVAGNEGLLLDMLGWTICPSSSALKQLLRKRSVERRHLKRKCSPRFAQCIPGALGKSCGLKANTTAPVLRVVKRGS